MSSNLPSLADLLNASSSTASKPKETPALESLLWASPQKTPPSLGSLMSPQKTLSSGVPSLSSLMAASSLNQNKTTCLTASLSELTLQKSENAPISRFSELKISPTADKTKKLPSLSDLFKADRNIETLGKLSLNENKDTHTESKLSSLNLGTSLFELANVHLSKETNNDRKTMNKLKPTKKVSNIVLSHTTKTSRRKHPSQFARIIGARLIVQNSRGRSFAQRSRSDPYALPLNIYLLKTVTSTVAAYVFQEPSPDDTVLAKQERPFERDKIKEIMN